MRGARLVWAAFTYTVLMGLGLAFVPIGGSNSVTVTASCRLVDGREVCTEETIDSRVDTLSCLLSSSFNCSPHLPKLWPPGI